LVAKANKISIHLDIRASKSNSRGVSHYGLAIYIKKHLKAKEEELWKLKYFTMQKYGLQKIPLIETKILQDIITLELISSFFQHEPKYHLFKKSSYKN
jgi:hypothetical protein